MNNTPLQVHIAGRGKLATELLAELRPQDGLSILPWRGTPADAGRGIVVHAGSGREIEAISAFCARSGSTLVELSTGSALEQQREPGFPVLLCPNTNILMLKFMHMLARSGPLFAGTPVRLIESHQASKHSVPGTAVQMAQALGLPAQSIESVRDPARQATEFHIPPEHLARHAFHRISLEDGPCAITLEARVLGGAPYASGVQKILGALAGRALPARVQAVTELIEMSWL